MITPKLPRRLLTRSILFISLIFCIFQLSQYFFYSTNHYSTPHHTTSSVNSPPPPPRSQEVILSDFRPFWKKLVSSHSLSEYETPVFVRRLSLSSPGDESGTGGGNYLLKVKQSFLGAHGFGRIKSPDINKAEERKGGDKEKEFHFPISGGPTIALPDTKPDLTKGSKNASEVLLATISTYSRAVELVDVWAESLVGTGAGLILGLEGNDNNNNAVSEAELISLKNLLYSKGVKDVLIFSIIDDPEKGNSHAQLFQRIMMGRYGIKSEEINIREKKWFGIFEDDVKFQIQLGELIKSLDGLEGAGYIGLPVTEGEIGVVLMRENVLDTVGQLMCFQGGGKGIKPGEMEKRWDEVLEGCLREGGLEYHLVVGEAGYNHQQQNKQKGGEGKVYREGKELITKIWGEDDRKPDMLFRDNWVIYSSDEEEKRIAYYSTGVEVRRVKQEEETQKGEGEGGDRKVIIHSPWPPVTGALRWRKGPKVEKLVWREVKKSWRLIEIEVKEVGGGRREVWEAYVNRRGEGKEGEGDEGEERSEVDSVVVLIWEVVKQ